MPKYYIGEFIRETRERCGYTQEELSYGICTPASLSWIETGVQKPGYKKLDALLERLGYGNSAVNEFISVEEMHVYNLTTKIQESIIEKDYSELEKLLDELEPLLKNKSDFERQYFWYAKGILLRSQTDRRDEVLKLYMKAIHITLPEFDGENVPENKLLTYDEITIINCIASIHAEKGNINEALKLGFWLKHYLEKGNIDENERKKKYPMIMFNLTNWLGERRRYDDVLEVAECGINFCVKTGTLRCFPLIIFNKACALAELGQINESIRYFTQATVIFESMGDTKKMKRTVAWCKDKYNIVIDVIV